MRLNENVMKYLFLTLMLFLTAGWTNNLQAQQDKKTIKVTDRGVKYVVAGWETTSIYDPYNYTFYISEGPQIKTMFTRNDYYVSINSLDRSPVFSFNDTCLLEEDPNKQLECSNNELFEYIKYQNIDYPDKAKENNSEGVVFVSFMLNKDGQIENISVLEKGDECKPCNDAAVDVIKDSESKWYAAMKDGKTITTHLTVPVRFKIFEIPDGTYPDK
ncbi:MAG: energy transducer TonB [Saprospiraceae bacterium]|nr:energy transducer TonB [Saprospiraceae bacterium]